MKDADAASLIGSRFLQFSRIGCKVSGVLEFFGLAIAGIVAIATCAAAAAESRIHHVSRPTTRANAIIDTREAAQCEAASLKGARCLPVHDFLGPHRRLANFSGLLWLLGTAGLTGGEIALVIGDESFDKEFMAGLLYLAGQKEIILLTTPVAKLEKASLSRGIVRSKTREQVFQARMRSNQIILRGELAAQILENRVPVLLDGRSEAEYWGQTIRASRGGHLPGAQHYAMARLRPGSKTKPTSPIDKGATAIAYGHNSYDSIVYLARLIAGGVPTKVYLEGWAGWASDGALPADSATYPDQRRLRPPTLAARDVSPGTKLPYFALMLLYAIGLFAAGFIVSRVIATNKEK